MAAAPTGRDILKNGIWAENPLFRHTLGICSTLAVTNVLANTLVMCSGLLFTMAMSSLTVSLLRQVTPGRIRMMVQTLIIASYVIVVDIVIRAYQPEIGDALGPYVGLIITNCIVMGRCEACGTSQAPGIAFVDGVFNALGYSFVLLIVATFREVLGMGTFLGYAVPYFGSEAWDKWVIMVMPPGAFFMLAIVVWVFRSIQLAREDKAE